MGVRDACGHTHWDLRRGPPWGHEACEGCADMGVRDACGHTHWDFRWSPLCGHEACEVCVCVCVCRNGRAGRMRAGPLRSVEQPMGPRSV
eukprot:9466671-Pyramimonas_sp.AAC.1